MITITKQLRTETGHRLMDYAGRCAHIHGHSYLWEVTITAKVEQPVGMVLDFAILKAAMNYVLDPFDHALILRVDDPLLQVIESENLLVTHASEMRTPRLVTFPFNPTCENLGNWVFTEIGKSLDERTINRPDLVKLTKLKVWETANSFCEVVG